MTRHHRHLHQNYRDSTIDRFRSDFQDRLRPCCWLFLLLHPGIHWQIRFLLFAQRHQIPRHPQRFAISYC